MDRLPIIAEGDIVNLGDNLNLGPHYIAMVGDAPSSFHLEVNIPKLGWRKVVDRSYPGGPGLVTEFEFKVVSPHIRIVFDKTAKLHKKTCVIIIQKLRNSPN